MCLRSVAVTDDGDGAKQIIVGIRNSRAMLTGHFILLTVRSIYTVEKNLSPAVLGKRTSA